MALHGPLLVGRQTVGYWQARRITTNGQDGVNTYKCTVEWTPDGHHRPRGHIGHARAETFTLEHRYTDGAPALAAAVLTRAAELWKAD